LLILIDNLFVLLYRDSLCFPLRLFPSLATTTPILSYSISITATYTVSNDANVLNNHNNTEHNLSSYSAHHLPIPPLAQLPRLNFCSSSPFPSSRRVRCCFFRWCMLFQRLDPPPPAAPPHVTIVSLASSRHSCYHD
jgi:hypothetical protein